MVKEACPKDDWKMIEYSHPLKEKQTQRRISDQN
jgi:hypothetical protein